jgi:hypothetical protein
MRARAGLMLGALVARGENRLAIWLTAAIGRA